MLFRCLFLTSLFLWSTQAFSARIPAADPAVAFANSVRKGEISYKEGYFGKGDDRLHFVEAGKGPLIILYHGFPSFWYSYFDQMEILKTSYRVVAVDALGAGLSAKPLSADIYRIKSLAGQLDRLARHLDGRRRFILVGHDWGAALAFAYAQAYPSRLTAVVGISAPPFNQFLELVQQNSDQQSRSQYMQLFRAMTLADLSKPGMTERIWQQSYSGLVAKHHLTTQEAELFQTALSDPRAINGGMNWYRANIPPFEQINASHRWPRDNARIKVPSLLIWGAADQTFVSDFIEKYSTYAHRPKIVTLPEVGHWATMEEPEKSAKAIVDFLDQFRGLKR